ncbi:MAG: protein meaA [Rickettsiales bacterium]|nr:protein meaA [Rickettsiales bacterium]OUV54522.1 MAG: protein meaA [Rickettsiales bacterium TMED127]|tara:strand:+ start:55833 stop:57809 length:1977 start_codon:yes stop_codon:yes gene_type:complete
MKNEKDKPWVIRTYAGHSSAEASNKLYKENLSKGQTGLSVAFDLPTQTGYDSDFVLSKGEVGKVGVPISHIGNMMTLFNEIPLKKMNTSMTINAPAAWLLSLYIATAEKQGAKKGELSGTTQNDITKEYLSRGTYIFPPEASLKLTSDIIKYTTLEVPKWNPMNVCSYHLQEAGATPDQELSFALATAIGVVEYVKKNSKINKETFEKIVGRISFFVNSGMRFITETAKMIAFTELWEEICSKRFKIKTKKYKRFRYGMQVNSLGLTESQPENNVYRILIQMLPVVMAKNSRARAVQLPAWNEALGLPRPWDQQWSLRLQQIMAYETDLLEFGDIFSGSSQIREKVDELKNQANNELREIDKFGGLKVAIENGYMKKKLVSSQTIRQKNIENGMQKVVGVNCFTEGVKSPLMDDEDGGFMKADQKAEKKQIENVKQWKASRSDKTVKSLLNELSEKAKSGENIMPISIKCAHGGITSGEWGNVMRSIFGEYRAPTGITSSSFNLEKENKERIKIIRNRVNVLTKTLGRRPKMLVGKPGLDGHSNGAEQIAVRARDIGLEVVYDGIRSTPEQLVNTCVEEGISIIGLSILSGSHIFLVKQIFSLLKKIKMHHIPMVVGGIIPPEDEKQLIKMGVSRVFTPKNFKIEKIMSEIIEILENE